MLELELLRGHHYGERKLYAHQLQSVKLGGFGVETMGQVKCQRDPRGFVLSSWMERPLEGGDTGSKAGWLLV